MSKSKLMISVALIMMVILSACSSLSLPVATTSSTPTSAASAAQAAVESKLGPGILKLEGTSQAITTAQASDLLFLWKGVKALTNTQNSSNIELAALYTQIDESLTAEQQQAIAQLNLTQTELSAMQAQYGASLAQASKAGGTTSTTSSSSQSQSNNGGFVGGGPDGGPGGNSDIAVVLGGASSIPSTSATTTSSTTKKSSSAPTVKAAVDLNALFADPVIGLLQQRVGL